ncbi:Ig-like domain-containing protein [Neobacillus drentensis]|uniref:Ig-like domain-containing protein n=1 Tax=Neobacillus drentensis TaxID=220684 RepID=UPI001F37F9A5|nr:Ig-like domain-containing protein [Neobacillus drentensis]ULT56666.1 Ig-like domain-containing protein [Neobacillus drentensis]
MKSILWRAGVLACLILLGCSWSYKEASAEALWPSKCAKVNANQNPSFQQMNCLLTNAALEANIPPEVVKAVATKENGGWRQFEANGQPVIAPDGGIGLMQITNQPNYDQSKLKTDIYYNIQAGVDILKSMYQRTDLPKIQGAGPEVIENWYFPVMAYNGTKPVNSPLIQADGTKNTKAYQEKVFGFLQQESFLGDTKLAQYPFSTADFQYDPNSDANIVFKKPVYTLTDQLHASTALFHTGDKVVVTEDQAKLRSIPTSSTTSLLKELALNTTLIISGNFVFDQNTSSVNQFVWYPVKTEDQKLVGYISSAYLTKKLEVSQVDDNDLSVSGKAPAYGRVQVKNGTTQIATAVADANGFFKAGIAPQKAGTTVTVSYEDKQNARSFSTTVSVTDKTAPTAPVVNAVTNKSADVTGKTEPYAILTATIAGKAYSIQANLYGNYKLAIPIQNAGMNISVTAKDRAGNVSAARAITVVKVAPNLPVVNTVNNKAWNVTGKTEANAIVTVAVSGKAYTAKANAYGNYNVAITPQNTGTKLSITAKDSAGRVSAARGTAVIRVAPNMPTVNAVRYTSTTVTGNTEKYAIVIIKIGSKTYTTQANLYGNYKVYIPKQNAGTKLYVYAKDAKAQTSAVRTATVSK